MGWSDISISLSGPIVDSLAIHFVDRWNYIFDDKYTNRDVGKYFRLEKPNHAGPSEGLLGEGEELFGGLHHHFSKRYHRFLGDEEEEPERPFGPNDGAHIQLLRRQDYSSKPQIHTLTVRSSSEWSSGLKTEHSIANAYIQIITQAKHFVYIENQVRPPTSTPPPSSSPNPHSSSSRPPRTPKSPSTTRSAAPSSTASSAPTRAAKSSKSSS